eukprot:5052272-Pyramimonas_sp.AAC.1
MPKKMTLVASERPACSIANGANSWKTKKAIIPPTAASIPSTTYSLRSTGNSRPTTTTAGERDGKRTHVQIFSSES